MNEYLVSNRTNRSVFRAPSRTTVAVYLACCWVITFVSEVVLAQSNYGANSSLSTMATLQMRASADVDSNLLKLGDIVQVKAPAEWQSRLESLPLGPSPILGKTQSLTVDDIKEILLRRGYNPAQFRWEGGSSCRVSRVRQSVPVASQSATIVENPPSSMYRLASGPTNTPPRSTSPLTRPDFKTVPDRDRFVPTNTSPTVVVQAERIATQAITNYLQTKADANVPWKVFPIISPEVAPHLVQRRQILGVTGGVPPWDGEQIFELLLRDPQGEYTITIPATVQLPDLVVASSRQLSKGHILRAEDLVHIPMPRNLKIDSDDYFTSFDDLIGKELKRSMSTNQVIRASEAGTQTLVQAGDAIKIVVQTASIVVETHGRALSSGGHDDLVIVEDTDYKGRLTARVTGPREVQVTSHGTTIQRTAKNRNTANRIQR